MGIRDWLARRLDVRNQADGTGITISSPDQLEAYILGVVGGSSAGVAVNVTSAQQVAAVHASVRVISESIAQLPCVLFRRDGTKRNPAVDHPVYALLHDRPNEWMTAFEWRELVSRHLNFRGNHYSLIVRGYGDRVLELLPMHPDRVKVQQDPVTLALSYIYTRADGRRVVYPRRNVLHIRGLGDDGVVGLDPISLYREAIGLTLATQRHGSRFFANGAKPSGLLEIEGSMDAEARTAMREDFESLFSGENTHRTATLPKGVSFKDIQMSNDNAQFLETRKYQRSEIASLFRVPPHMIGDLEKATFSNIEHQAVEFVVHSLTPWLVRIEQALGRDLLNDAPDLFFKFNVDALLRGDSKSRAEALNIKRRAGVINANEWRALDDMNPREDEGGDEYIVEQNMTPQSGNAKDEEPAK